MWCSAPAEPARAGDSGNPWAASTAGNELQLHAPREMSSHLSAGLQHEAWRQGQAWAREETTMAESPDRGAQVGSWVRGIGAITLFVEDLAAAKRFYQRVFGLPVTFEDGNSAVFDFGNTIINLLKTTAAVELIEPAVVASCGTGSRLQFTIEVDDVDAMCAELAGRGVELLNGPMDRPWGVRTASFTDPGGHIWEIAR
jgi:catechol 2,3-dioxygenase-like lactoylglutathione lyase family enzyme